MAFFGNARALINGASANGASGGGGGILGWMKVNILQNKQLKTRLTSVAKYGMSWGQWGYSHARHIGWFLVTSALITAVPLIFEYNREMQLEELERLQVAKSLAEGASPYALREQGLSSAVEPKVL